MHLIKTKKIYPFLLTLATSLVLSMSGFKKEVCVMKGNHSGCDTWTSCNGGTLAFVQILCWVDDGDNEWTVGWTEYYITSAQAGCGGCEA